MTDDRLGVILEWERLVLMLGERAYWLRVAVNSLDLLRLAFMLTVTAIIIAMEEEIQIPSFTLYPLTTQDLKTCYEAEKYKVLCSLEGPHYPRRNTQLAPHFNIRISAGATSLTTE